MPARLLRIRGLVQGVGFRPYVWRLAGELGLAGWVRNDGADVSLLVAGERLDEFLARLPREAPPLARVDAINIAAAEPPEQGGFAILRSLPGALGSAIGPDAALCPECIADVFDPAGRRWRYAFTTCTHCGPRYTVSHGLPYDRARTSLAAFPLCPPCAAEYADPADRRFHAETTCCPDCGPRLSLLDAAGQPLPGDALAAALALLRAGRIVAIKGLGGFHLACDARNAAAVTTLRERKQREAKPFAIMGLNPASLAGLARIDAECEKLLRSPAGPIVLCPKAEKDDPPPPLPNPSPARGEGLQGRGLSLLRQPPRGEGLCTELPGIAPGLAWLGVMLPATPLHLLLWHEAAGRPSGSDWLAEISDLLLVMTSANPHGEPLVIGNGEALDRLAGIADAYLVHDRDIVVRCDDSLLRAGPILIRRARGYVPLPVPLSGGGPCALALGGFLKTTLCLMRDDAAWLSQHIGSLDNVATLGFLEEMAAHLPAILEARPQLVVHDLHPDYPSSALARRLADELGVPALAVGHHHAHIAAVLAEHRIETPVLGLAIDGVGLGPDGCLWGGELLRVAGAACTRLGHLRPLPLPGGDRAAREPWRMGLAALHVAGLGERSEDWRRRRFPQHETGPLLAMLAANLRCPPSSSLGRWFDAAAGLLGCRAVQQYEGQAAMELEGLAAGWIASHGPLAPLAGGWRLDSDGTLDLTPLVPALLDCDDAPYGAALFHATLAAALADWLLAAARREGLETLAAAGGCALNAVLMRALRGHLENTGLRLLEARRVPPNDGGLALGQAWIGRQHLQAQCGK
ncbi:MAG: carbamoyltransferase HypF [Betaproteobacteria bacterium]|nr:carbamoyltransferase HypF [Betaproteobacteria bacterium]